MAQSHQEDLERRFQEAQGSIARLQQQVEGQTYQLQQQAQKIQRLEEELGQANLQLAHAPQIDERLEHLKSELLQIMEQRYGRQQSGPSATNIGLINQQLENHTKALNDLQRNISKAERYDDQISLARTESTRLNKEVRQLQADLEKFNHQLDTKVRPLTFIEEQNRSTSRTLAELQAELPDLHKKIASNLAKIELIEKQAPQFTQYQAALDDIREDIRRHREHMDYQAAERERHLKNLSDLSTTTEQRLKENEQLMEKYTEHYQLNKRALASLQEFQEQLQREQHRFGELQRLAEDRQRSEMEKYQANYEQRWNKQSMELEPQIESVQKSMGAIQQRVDELSKILQSLEQQMNMVLQIIEEDAQARAVAVSDWQDRLESLANGQDI